MTTEGSRFVPRAERLTVPSSILYRPAGEFRWRQGEAENISRSGVLGKTTRASLGRGRIVRRETERFDARPIFAAAISDWEMLQVDPRRI